MASIRTLTRLINHGLYMAAAALILASLVLSASPAPAEAAPSVCPAGYMLTIPDEGDTTAPFCIPKKVIVCHRNNGRVGYSKIKVSINSVTSNKDWWVKGHGQHTIAGGEVGFPEDAWPDFYARNGDFIAAYGNQTLVANGCSIPATNTATPTSTAIPPTTTPTQTPTNTPEATLTPTNTPASTSTPFVTETPVIDETPDPTITPTDPTGGDDPTPVPTFPIPVTGEGESVVESTALLIPVTGVADTPGVKSLNNTGFALLGLGLVMSGIRRKYNF